MTRLGRYHVVGRIATGGMAEVYLAVHGELAGFRTPVVLKKVLPHLACNPEFIDMFLDEARIASLLDHPNVVRIYEVGKSESEYFLAMELVQGKPMQALLRLAQEAKVTALEPRLAAFIVAQAASGLHYAHNLTDPLGNGLGLVHRDVSPHNILLSFEGSVKVIDFGVARALGRITETQTGGRKGKFGYMSPEQARGEDLDLRADIFALGVVLWEAVTGTPVVSARQRPRHHARAHLRPDPQAHERAPGRRGHRVDHHACADARPSPALPDCPRPCPCPGEVRGPGRGGKRHRRGVGDEEPLRQGLHDLAADHSHRDQLARRGRPDSRP